MSTQTPRQTKTDIEDIRPTRQANAKMFTKRTIPLYLMISPVLLLTFLFQYVPLPGRLIAFMDWRIMGFNGWVGLAHFKYLFKLDYFWQSFWNNWRFILLERLFMFPSPIILALLLNEIRAKKFKKTVQTLTTVPNFVNWVVIGGIFTTLLSPRYGWINDIIRVMGGEPVYFLSLERFFPYLLTFLRMWKGVGWSAIIYLAALSGIDDQLYEAAVIDGASRWRQTLQVTLPGISGTIIVLFVLSFANVFRGLFEPVFIMKNPLVNSKAEILDTYIFEVGLRQSKYGLGAAAGLFKISISVTLLLMANWLSKKITPDKKPIL
jgi:putative aldouronate transport system permease protein